MKIRRLKIWLLPAVLLAFLPITATAQSTSFTYQGKLTDGGNPANGSYDLQFALFDSLAGATQIGSTQTSSAVAVTTGIFTVQLDFGSNAFPGANRFLEISVRPAGGGSFTILAPRQQISSTPYAIRTLTAGTADTATNATQLGGVAANQYVQTNDSRLTDARPPTAGSGNYIQNTNAQQTAAFNITGNGAVGGNFGVGTANSLARLQVASGGETQTSYTARFQSSPNVAGAGGILFDQNSTYGWKIHTENTGTSFTSSLHFNAIRVSDGAIESLQPAGVMVLTKNAVGINAFPTANFDVFGTVKLRDLDNGPVCVGGPFGHLVTCGASSLRLKTNISQFRSGLDIVRRLRPISFDWKDGSGHDIGLGAEDVAKIAPSFTFTDKKGEIVGIKYDRLNMLLINAIKEQQKQIEQFRSTNARLSARLRAVEKRLKQRTAR